MKFSNVIFLVTSVIGILIVNYPVPSHGEFSISVAWKNTTINEKVQSYLSTAYFSVLDRIINRLAIFLIEKKRQKLNSEEPIEYEFFHRFNIKDKTFRASGYITNVTLPNSSQFQLQNSTSRKAENALYYELHWKKLTANDVKYEMRGKAYDMPIKGNGKIYADFTAMKVNVSITYRMQNQKMQIQKMKLSYAFQKLQMRITGLKVPFLSNEAVNSYASLQTSNYLRKNQHRIAKKISAHIIKTVNAKLEQFTFIDFLKMLWSTFTSTKQETKTFQQLTEIVADKLG